MDGIELAKPVLSTMYARQNLVWQRHVHALPSRTTGPRDQYQLLRASRGRQAVILRGSVPASEGYRDLVFATLLKLRPPSRRPLTLISDATGEVGSAALEHRLPFLAPAIPRLAKLVIRARYGEHVRYGVLSSAEVATFPRTWRVPAERVVFTPFPHTLYDGGEDRPTSTGDYLFAGGNSLRDCALLERALEIAPQRTIVAGRWRPERPSEHITAGQVPKDRYGDLLAGARACVVPLRRAERSAGQQTYLNAMVLGKPVVVTDAPGVRDYVQHGVTGLVVDPEPTALAEAIERVMDPHRAEENAAMGRRAREAVLARFTPDAYLNGLLRVVGALDEFSAEA